MPKVIPLSFERPKESLAKKSRPLPYNCLKIARNGCKNLTPRPTKEHVGLRQTEILATPLLAFFLTAIIRRPVCRHAFSNQEAVGQPGGLFFRIESFLKLLLDFERIFEMQKRFGQQGHSTFKFI